ncbi:hypothetical protein HYPSUDRAFT_114029, partial [Hypholoma sublateritium FD-334 SS-4]
GHGRKTKFDVQVQREGRLLRKGVIAYTEPEITLVLSPLMTRPRSDERTTHFSPTILIVGDAPGVLDDLCTDFATTPKQIVDIGADLAHKGQMGADSASEVQHPIPTS